MPYVITQNCCKDASCVPVCPVDCIRPNQVSAGTEMLYIDPDTCIDCGACQEVCPVDAIYSADQLPQPLAPFAGLNAAYFDAHPLRPADPPVPPARRTPHPSTLRVAIVGAGPAACHAATDLLGVRNVEIELFDRLPTPFGLIRAGVAPDHQATKNVVRVFDRGLADPRLHCHFNVEIGTRITHADLLAHHHAVIYAVGASAGRKLGIGGEQLPGHHSAVDFVSWYNGHPDATDVEVNSSHLRAVIIGNGNVALDIARMLLLDPDRLAATDIADHALGTLSRSMIREVVILARRGPREAAFSVGEFLALGDLDGVDIQLVGADDLTVRPGDDVETAAKLDIARSYAARPVLAGNKRLVLRFHTEPVELLGPDRVRALRVRGTGAAEGADEIPTGLVISAIGYRGRPIEGLGFDEERGIIPNDRGKVVDAPGAYVTGWIKRGPRGVIGTNRTCAAETVSTLLADFDAGLLDRGIGDRQALGELLTDRGITEIGWPGWLSIDAAERARGAQVSRPRRKFVTVDDLLGSALSRST